MSYYISRVPHAQAGETLSQQYVHTLSVKEKHDTASMLVGNSTERVLITNIYPQYIRLGSKEASPIASLRMSKCAI